MTLCTPATSPPLALGLLLAGCGDDGDASTGQASTDDAATIPNSSTSDSPTGDATHWVAQFGVYAISQTYAD
jgi:hypothetical protein